MPEIITGNILDLADQGHFDVIIQGCNCFNTMGGGLAAQVAARYPEAYAADQATHRGDRAKLGTYTKATVEGVWTSFTIVNAYTQYRYGSGLQADYTAIKQVFEKIARDFYGYRISYPMIGAGLAGGDWQIIYPIICKALENCEHTLVVYG